VPTPTSSANADLNKILYQAQVDEVAKLRAVDTRTGSGVDFSVLIIGLVAGGLAVAFLPRAFQAKQS
jgi:hypothetical protein